MPKKRLNPEDRSSAKQDPTPQDSGSEMKTSSRRKRASESDLGTEGRTASRRAPRAAKKAEEPIRPLDSPDSRPMQTSSATSPSDSVPDEKNLESPILSAHSSQVPPITSAKGDGALASSVSTRERIALLAYSYWEARGRQGGSPEQDWYRAEREVLGGLSARDH